MSSVDETRRPKELQYFNSPTVFDDLYQLRNLWSMVYEVIYHCLLANQNSGIAIYHCWREIINWWNEKRSENCTLNATDILYGYKPDCTKFYALNPVLIIAKYHIFQAWLDNSSPSFEIFYLVLKDKILCESRIAFKNNTLPKFRSKWTTLCALAPQNVSL